MSEGSDPIHEAFGAVDQMRRQRFTLATPGFDREEVLAALSTWARTLERALVAVELQTGSTPHEG